MALPPWALPGHHVATVEMGPDLFLAVDDGSGWRFVGGNWPDLGLVFYGHFRSTSPSSVPTPAQVRTRIGAVATASTSSD